MLLAPLGGLVLAVPLVLLSAAERLVAAAGRADGRRAGAADPGPAPRRAGRHRRRARLGAPRRGRARGDAALGHRPVRGGDAAAGAAGAGGGAVVAGVARLRPGGRARRAAGLPRGAAAAVHRRLPGGPGRRAGAGGRGQRVARCGRSCRWRAWWSSPRSVPPASPSWPGRAGSRRPGATTAGSPSPGRGTTAGPFAESVGGSVGLAVAATCWSAPLVAVGAAVLLARRCVRRFGGVTGDVYGACVELAFTTMLVVPALLLP